MPSEESMIEDLRELESELREKEEYRKANIIDLFIRYSTHCKINKSKIKEKAEEYRKKSEEYEEKKKDDFMGFWQLEFLKACHKYQALEELLKEEK